MLNEYEFENLISGDTLEIFPEKLSEVSDEHGERLHHDVMTMGKRYQGKWTASVLAEYCWTMKKYVHGKNTG